MEEPRLLHGLLLRSDVFCLLELLSHFSVLLLPCLPQNFVSLLLIVLFLLFKFYHVLVCSFQLQSLRPFPHCLARICLWPQFFSLLLFNVEPVLQLSNLVFLDVSLSFRLAPCLLDLFQEFLLFLGEIIDPADHFLFVVVGLGQRVCSPSVRAYEVT